MKKFILIITCTIPFFLSCKKCKECYLIEESNGTITETPIGEFCGDEIEEKENQELIGVSGPVYNECR
jgi:hypothetical protein